MRITTHYSVVFCTAFGLLANIIALPASANDDKGAHAMAHRFANAHKPKPAKVKPENAIQAKEVEGAFKVRSQETDLKTTDQILDSIEARTKAIEALLEKSTSDKWDVNVGKPATVVIQKTPTTPISAAPEAQSPDADPGVTSPLLETWAATTNPATPLTPTTPVTDPLFGADITTQSESGVEPDQPPHETTELPNPAYALGGPANLRYGLEEASNILSTATVLLKMEPGNTGLRRFKKTADPVLCGRRHCYMSKGLDQKAQRMQRGATLGPFNTLGRRAGACRQKLVCAFRHVDLMDDGVLLQPVDLKFMRHDRRAYRNVKADSTCAISAGRLHCANPVKAKTWTAWIVPEHVAVQAGPEALEAALQDGLPETPVPTIQVQHSAE